MLPTTKISKETLIQSGIPPAFHSEESLDFTGYHLDGTEQHNAMFREAKERLVHFVKNAATFKQLGGTLFVQCQEDRRGYAVAYSTAVSLLLRGLSVSCLTPEGFNDTAPMGLTSILFSADYSDFLFLLFPSEGTQRAVSVFQSIVSRRSASGLPLVVFSCLDVRRFGTSFPTPGNTFITDMELIEFPPVSSGYNLRRRSALKKCLQA